MDRVFSRNQTNGLARVESQFTGHVENQRIKWSAVDSAALDGDMRIFVLEKRT